MILLAFVGPMGCGKTAAALNLSEHHGYARMRFAGPLKAMLKAIGLTDRHVDGDLKEVPCDLLGGTTPRHAMQTLGTEWGRELITGDLWIRAWEASLAELPQDSRVVVDDCRFPNEAARLRTLGGKIIRINRPGYSHNPAHPSERHVLEADIGVLNSGTLAEFHQRVHDAIDSIGRS